MCIILDADSMGDMNGPSEHGAPVLRWLLTGGGGLVIGGKQKRELSHSEKLRTVMVTLSQAGRLQNLDDDKVDALTKVLKPSCQSNDPHVIAVAALSGCRLIFSHDKNLHRDAKNKDILSPTASIYQNKDHQHLLEPCHCKEGK